ncbi:hypothetical protein OE88DRAFT_715166 [Heliocybe sulcata]|uniref:Uncharacterized protein n=1 Tax=Heliocybe sulcata TaxID=5364 RepID=A0A5C3NFK8_9AGAM|nr:hypothetical protein OE88DRAFT_715166 [Heliocybe sulcata]
MLSMFEMQDWGKEKVGRLIVAKPQEVAPEPGTIESAKSNVNSTRASTVGVNVSEVLKTNQPVSTNAARERSAVANVARAERTHPNTVPISVTMAQPAQESAGADLDVYPGIPQGSAKQTRDAAKLNRKPVSGSATLHRKDHHSGLGLAPGRPEREPGPEVGCGVRIGNAQERSRVTAAPEPVSPMVAIAVRKDDRGPLTPSRQFEPQSAPPSTLGKRYRGDVENTTRTGNRQETKKKRRADVGPEEVVQDVVICNNAIKRILRSGTPVDDETVSHTNVIARGGGWSAHRKFVDAPGFEEDPGCR